MARITEAEIQPSHTDIALQIAALDAVLQDMRERSSSRDKSLNQLSVSFASFDTTLRDQVAIAKDVQTRVMALELTNAEKRGERGVVAALLGSKALAWLLAMFATGTLWMTHGEAKLP